jgi:hypothetical protein
MTCDEDPSAQALVDMGVTEFGIDEIVLSFTAKGLTTGEVAAHFADVYGATVRKDTISRHRQGGWGDGRVAQPAVGGGAPASCYPRRSRVCKSWAQRCVATFR